ncbi:hypothetical protein CSV77_15840 [Sporosarcina sp. P16b]|uniref:hypothetical protein n=1 Tax=Sporosarcina sp. P16b TaxID=2048261 RepID=UPI000C1639D2|nr:hypothetical protein [Sporosarcina sp. P16b]PIC69039.1 hypothetical protein CSV77_15840 [Sporosarcina sp. P16b]
MGRTKEELRERKKKKFLKVSETLRVCDSCEYRGLVMTGDSSQIKVLVETICGACPNYKRMRSVGDELWHTDTNIEAILEKKQEITTQEIRTLLEEGVTKKKIREALGFHSVIEFREFILTIANK